MNLEDIKKVSVIGGGIMGFGIAINFARNGYSTLIQDLNDETVARSKQLVQSAMALFVEESLLSQAQADDTVSRISWTTDLAEAAQSDFITEAIVERLKDKQDLFNALDNLLSPTNHHRQQYLRFGDERNWRECPAPGQSWSDALFCTTAHCAWGRGGQRSWHQ